MCYVIYIKIYNMLVVSLYFYMLYLAIIRSGIEFESVRPSTNA